MIDKKTEQDIRGLEEFLEFWTKFHALYGGLITRATISEEDESKFLEQKEMIRKKYEGLVSALEFRYTQHGRLTDPVSDILALEGVRFMSEKNMHKRGDDWRDSYIFLNSILERLKNKKRRLEQFSPVGVFFKRVMERI